jgi:hypothetical protein
VKADGPDDQLIELWESNREALVLFLDVSTQWRSAHTEGGTRYLGLDYVAVDVVMRRLSIDDPAGQLFTDLQAAEDGALEAFSELGMT